MKRSITPAQMKELETRFMQENAVPGALLMEHAAMGVADAVARHVRRDGLCLFLCGPGNNGGDGYAAARLWAARGGRSQIVELTSAAKGDAQLNRTLAQMAGIPISVFRENDHLPPCDGIVDALFGTGLTRYIDSPAAELIVSANHLSAKHGIPIIAVDIPSGIDGTTGRKRGAAIVATETVTFHRIKQGLLLDCAPNFTGKITVQPILIPTESPLDDEYAGLSVLEPADLSGDIFHRPQTCHKGDFGRVVLFCGSRGMAGAAALCANGAIRAGAGLTTILCRESLLPILQTLAPGAMCTVLPERDGALTPVAADIARTALSRADAACIGCGLSPSADNLPLLRVFHEAACPVVWDADALNLLAKTGDLPLKPADVITPHPGEAARLLGCTADAVTADTLSALRILHNKCGCTVLLKGARSLITNGRETFVNMHASPALAKGGSGDVLAGIITALLGRRVTPLSSASAAAYGALIHGLAGVRAAKQHGENCTLPTDVVDCTRMDADGLD